MFSRSTLLPLAALILTAAGQTETCESYGVDFQDGGSYFINTLSTQNFTCASQFNDCQNGTAYIMLVDPNENAYECTNVPTLPDYTTEVSTCPIQQNQMFSGDWTILVLGNNVDDPSFAYQREFYLDCAPQVTVTATPTVTFNKTVTPTYTTTVYSTIDTTTTIPASKTVVVPASTHVVTVTPKPVTTTSYEVITRTYKQWTQTKTIEIVTVAPKCTVPPRQPQPDSQCRIVPKGFNWPHINKMNKRDAAVDSAGVAARFAAIRAKRDAANAVEKRAAHVKRSFDSATTTTTLTSPVISTTITETAASVAVTDLILKTKTITDKLPPTTIHSGVKRTTITIAPKTKTIVEVRYTATTWTRTLTATLTHTTTITPSASATSCKKQGGHFGRGWQWYKN